MFALCLAALAGCAHRPWEDPGDGWRRIASEHFAVVTDADDEAYGPVVDRLEEVHAALSTTFFEGVSASGIDVLLFARTRDFEAVAPKDAAGFFAPGLGRSGGGLLVFPADADPAVVEAVAAHELAHRFLHALDPGVPAWLHEGFAKYVGGLRLVEDLVAFDMGDLHGGYAYFADPVPLERLLAAPSRDFHSADHGAHYMTAWMLVRNLLARPGAAPPARFRALVSRIVAAPDPAGQAAALRDVFGVPLPAVEREIAALHRALYHGVGQPTERRTMGVRFTRPPRRPVATLPADRGEVRAICRLLRGARG
jgi:hypothetical protein